MQYHLNGFKPGDPDVSQEARDAATSVQDALPAEVDVLIVGCGPAGLTLAAQLSAFPDIKTCIVEQKPGPLALGQADGVACRTMEMFEAFGFSAAVMREAYWVNETSFWKPEAPNSPTIMRHGRIQDVEDGLSEYPHLILNQARVHDYYLEIMRNSPGRLTPHYGRRLASLNIATAADAGKHASHPVTVSLERVDQPGRTETVRARYVVGCDGARSAVRPAIGQTLRGDSASQAWGVMDVLAVTDFPDIRLKALVQSAAEGSLLIIPREGGYLVRIYVELDKLNTNERVAARNITIEKLIAAAQRIFKPYTLDVKEVAWWSVYEIGQRLCDRFDDVPDNERATRLPHVFIAGDACHTHSPKAGQGMNVSMQDAFNLGWKLAAVLQGRSPPDLLHSYSAERQAIAAQLIDFDREWAAMLSAPLKTQPNGPGVEPGEVQRYFVQHGRYTAGTATRYTASHLTGAPTHQALATGLEIGTRFHSGPVIRLGDGKPMRLGDTLKADGRWRIIVFADRLDPLAEHARLRRLCDALAAAGSPVRRFTPAGADIDAVFDVRAVLQQAHRDIDVEALPALLLPRKGRYGLKDYEKVFCPDLQSGSDIFDLRGIDRAHGCMVVVRPDQYIAQVLPLDGIEALAAFFERMMIAQ
jgi:phenol 2-monooxygenase (NADPH)